HRGGRRRPQVGRPPQGPGSAGEAGKALTARGGVMARHGPKPQPPNGPKPPPADGPRAHPPPKARPQPPLWKQPRPMLIVAGGVVGLVVLGVAVKQLFFGGPESQVRETAQRVDSFLERDAQETPLTRHRDVDKKLGELDAIVNEPAFARLPKDR